MIKSIEQQEQDKKEMRVIIACVAMHAFITHTDEWAAEVLTRRSFEVADSMLLNSGLE